MKKKENTGLMLLCAVLFAISGLLNVWVAIRDGRGINMATAVVFLVCAVVWFGRWRRAKRNEDDQ